MNGKKVENWNGRSDTHTLWLTAGPHQYTRCVDLKCTDQTCRRIIWSRGLTLTIWNPKTKTTTMTFRLTKNSIQRENNSTFWQGQQTKPENPNTPVYLYFDVKTPKSMITFDGFRKHRQSHRYIIHVCYVIPIQPQHILTHIRTFLLSSNFFFE